MFLLIGCGSTNVDVSTERIFLRQKDVNYTKRSGQRLSELSHTLLKVSLTSAPPIRREQFR